MSDEFEQEEEYECPECGAMYNDEEDARTCCIEYQGMHDEPEDPE